MGSQPGGARFNVPLRRELIGSHGKERGFRALGRALVRREDLLLMKRLEVRLLGGFQVLRDGCLVPHEVWQHRRGAELVKVLALAREHWLHREQVIEALWPELPYDSALGNLHKAAHFARRAIGESDAVVVHGGRISLAPGAAVTTDVERFEAENDPALYSGELLPEDRYAEWASEARERLRLAYFRSLRARGRLEEVVAENPRMRRHIAR